MSLLLMIGRLSAIRRSAIIHDLIADEQLDILALSETWMCTDTLNCIKRDIAPEGFSVLHVHRSGTTGRPWSGGGLAIIYRSTLDVSVHPRFEELCTSTSLCEIQLARLGRASSSITIANIYRPLGAMGDFYDDLATLISSICLEAGERLCGDLNCADSQGRINGTLTDICNAYSLCQYVEVPTRGDNILDVLAADNRKTVNDTRMSDAGLVSDQKLIPCKITTSCNRQPVRHVFRNIKAVD